MQEEQIINKLRQNSIRVSQHQFNDSAMEDINDLNEFDNSKGLLYYLTTTSTLFKVKMVRYIPIPKDDPMKEIVADLNGKIQKKTDKIQDYEIDGLRAEMGDLKQKILELKEICSGINNYVKSRIGGIKEDVHNDMKVQMDIVEQRLKDLFNEKLKNSEDKDDDSVRNSPSKDQLDVPSS